MAKRRKRRSGENKDNYYFSEVQEKAILDYRDSTSWDERNRIYKTYLAEPLNFMVKSIFGKYHAKNRRFMDDDEREQIEYSAISHLVEQMVKFNPDRKNKKGEKVKAYSYCQTIVRNYFKDSDRNNYKKTLQDLPFEDYHEEIETREEYMYEMDYNETAELQELINVIIEKLKVKIDADKTLKKNEVIVGDAIIKILSDWPSLFMEETNIGKYNKKISNNFQKNKILFYLKELTDLSTKEIRSSMKQFRELYFFEKNCFFTDEV